MCLDPYASRMMQLASRYTRFLFIIEWIVHEKSPASPESYLAIFRFNFSPREISANNKTEERRSRERSARKCEPDCGKAARAARGLIQKWRRVFRASGTRAWQPGCPCGLHERTVE